jgi:chemotaxis protein MotB
MQQSGLREDQVSQVRGFSAQRLRNPKDPFDPLNRRISIIVQYLPSAKDAEEKPAETSGAAGKATPSAEGTKAEPPRPKGEEKKEESEKK